MIENYQQNTTILFMLKYQISVLRNKLLKIQNCTQSKSRFPNLGYTKPIVLLTVAYIFSFF